MTMDDDWEKFNNKLCALRLELEHYGSSREISIVKTKLDEAILWWQAERGFLMSTINEATVSPEKVIEPSKETLGLTVTKLMNELTDNLARDPDGASKLAEAHHAPVVCAWCGKITYLSADSLRFLLRVYYDKVKLKPQEPEEVDPIYDDGEKVWPEDQEPEVKKND